MHTALSLALLSACFAVISGGHNIIQDGGRSEYKILLSTVEFHLRFYIYKLYITSRTLFPQL
jgi:hypothetical protein